jgi:hypothetical protein
MGAMGTPQRKRDREYVEAATRKFREDLAALVAEHGRRGLEVRELLGDPGEFASRAVHATAPVPSPWDELVGPFTLSDGVQARLGITRQAVAAKAGRRRLLRVISADGVHLYPLWQFDGNRVVAGLPEILALFPEEAVDGWTLAGWLRTPEPELGEPPMAALARGEAARVQAAARMAARSLAA